MKSSIKGCGCCFFWLLVAVVLVATGLWLTTTDARAAALAVSRRQVGDASGRDQRIFLITDESPSMAECDGAPGSDPEFLRQKAARYFVSYLGADSAYGRYRVGLLQFGGETRQVMGLMNLANEVERQQLLAAVESLPEPISWTNPLAALYRARLLLTEQAGLPLPNDGTSPARTVVLLTDGDPAWPRMNETNQQAYRDALRNEILEYRAAEITLFIILLQNPANQCSQRVATYWQQLWQELAMTTPAGELYAVDQASDLLPAYHAIVRRLVGATDGDVLADDAAMPAEKMFEVPVLLEAPVAGMILTILKEAGTTVEVIAPDGHLIQATDPGVTVVENAQQSVIRLAEPMVGRWIVRLYGSGRVSVYQDRIPLPVPTATPISTATLAPTPAATPTATALPTPIPTIAATATPVATPTPLPPASSTQSTTLLPSSQSGPLSCCAPRGGGWLWLAGGFFALISGSAAYTLTRRHKGIYHAGRITIIQAPAGDPHLYLVEDLAVHNQKRFTIGKGVDGAWRLGGWSGRLELNAGPKGSTIASASGRDVLLLRNSRFGPVTKMLHYPTLLVDQDVLLCGDHHLRYNNVLAELSGKTGS